ncbi:retron St85 family effector protein [Chromobacterium phragmitis]|uniref:retron St85 family effector protein n=1 Tax=Chromobacterium phragmitis TaxID=2202141 RepID=UPI0011AE5149|nr:retron St85 family effector protein [Chromobacterium phragmitis]
MQVKDSRTDHIEKISLENTRVVLNPPIVFLCGGLVDIKEPTCSVRGALLDHLSKVRCSLLDSITLAESFKDWTHEDIYKDLMVFEDDLAHISSLIVIILESPGALAELGLFARNRFINKKILIIINDIHYDQDSFIKLGPLRHLEHIKDKSVSAYSWQEDSPAQTIEESLDNIREDILSALETQDKSEAFDKNNDGHLALFIFQIIHTYAALRITEIETYLKIHWPDIAIQKIKRLLFLLKKFSLVTERKKGHYLFYCPQKNRKHIEFAGHFDPNTAKVSAMQFYLGDSEKRRFDVIKQNTDHLKETGEIK